jgi:hypothetical protein
VQFLADVEAAKDLNPGERELLRQACRLIDRLDLFADMLEGDRKAWFEIDWPFEDAPAVVTVTSVVSEARQHVAELRQVVKSLNLPSAKTGAGVQPGPVNPMDELLAKRNAKGA